MSDGRLPFSATRVVKASPLDPTLKLVWLETQIFDRGEAGAYISASSLGKRLHMSVRTIERGRQELKRLGLFHVEQRGRGMTASWYCILPSDCVPPPRPTEEEVETLAGLLAAHLARLTTVTDDGPTTVTETGVQGPLATTGDGTPPSSVTALPAQSRGDFAPPLSTLKQFGELLQPQLGEVQVGEQQVGELHRGTSAHALERPENGNGATQTDDLQATVRDVLPQALCVDCWASIDEGRKRCTPCHETHVRQQAARIRDEASA